MNASWKKLNSTIAYTSQWLTIQHDEVIRPDGSKGTYDIVLKPDGLLVIPQINDTYYFVDQFRYPTGKRSIEFPQGSRDGDEDSLIGAKRELKEETGLVSDEWKKIGFLYLANGFTSQGYHFFVAKNCKQEERSLEASEADLIIKTYQRNELEKAIKEGAIEDSPTVAAWGLYLLHGIL